MKVGGQDSLLSLTIRSRGKPAEAQFLEGPLSPPAPCGMVHTPVQKVPGMCLSCAPTWGPRPRLSVQEACPHGRTGLE